MYIFLGIVAAVVVIIIQYAIADAFYLVAVEKGHDKQSLLWLCFFLGIIGYIYVAALPDRSSVAKTKKRNKSQTNRNEQIEQTGDDNLEDFEEEEDKEPVKSKLAQVKCPSCGKKHDFDYPKCPYCKHKYE